MLLLFQKLVKSLIIFPFEFSPRNFHYYIYQFCKYPVEPVFQNIYYQILSTYFRVHFSFLSYILIPFYRVIEASPIYDKFHKKVFAFCLLQKKLSPVIFSDKLSIDNHNHEQRTYHYNFTPQTRLNFLPLPYSIQVGQNIWIGKSQLISKGLFDVIISTKKNNQILLRISALASKEVGSKK